MSVVRTVLRTVRTLRTVTRNNGVPGADAEGGGVSAFADLTDKASADLPAINTPLATALSGKAATSHTHTASQISDGTETGRSLVTAATPAAARVALEILTSGVATDSTATTPSTWVESGATVALTSGTWRVQAFYHGSNATSSATNVRLSASANWTDTNGRRIATLTGATTAAGLTYTTGGTSSAANLGAAGLVAGEIIAIVKMAGSGTLSMQMTNTAATGTVTCFAGSHIVATKL